MEKMNNLVNGAKLITIYDSVIVFLEYYNDERPWDFIARTSKNQLRNFTFDQIKGIVYDKD